MGTLGRAFLGLVRELEPVAEDEQFVAPNEETTLTQIQRDIFLLQDRNVTEAIPAEDRSIRFHSCHSPMREMEVLHDQLLAIFEQDPALEPRDVVVMMPDIAGAMRLISRRSSIPRKMRRCAFHSRSQTGRRGRTTTWSIPFSRFLS